MYTLTFLVNLSVQFYVLHCFLYQDIKTIEFSKEEKYYGISVLLQNGTPPTILVGSPHHKETGSVHVLRLDGGSADEEIISAEVLEPNIPKTYLFGLSMDGGVNYGEPLLIGAPRFLKRQIIADTENFFCNGAGYYFRNVSSIRNPFPVYPNGASSSQIKNQTYYLGFGEAGFSVRYMDNNKDFLLGSPGLSSWAGGAIRIYESDVILPPQSRRSVNRNRRDSVYSFNHVKQLEMSLKDYDYGGYSVTIGRFSRGKLFYVIGAPKANDLLGAVYIVEKDDRIKEKVLQDAKNLGTYYGASVCVLDINGDGFDDLLVGAPTQSGRTVNEGSVYQYINDGNGELLLFGSFSLNTVMGQFGTSMTNLGKITLDSCDSVAISSPYENYGQGAVYIFTGSKEGLVYNQKVVASKRSLGFGYSLSRAVDIDGNLGTDFVVGAYQSNSVHVLMARTPFYFNVSFETVSHLFSQIVNKPFNFKYCVLLTNTGFIKANVTFIPDRRLQNQQDFQPFQSISARFCRDVLLSFNEEVKDTTTPLKLEILVEVDDCRNCPVLSPNYEKKTFHEIPFLFDCGDDQICTPKLAITTNLHNSKFLVGSKDSIKLIVDVTNSGEFAYICKLNLTLSTSLAIKSSPKVCKGYVCPLMNPLRQSDALEFELDMQQIKSVLPNLTLQVDVKCVNDTKISFSTLFLGYKSVLNVDGNKDQVIYETMNATFFAKSKHQYYFRNIGPSLLENFKFEVKIPRSFLFSQETQVFKIYEPKNANSNNVICESDSNYDDDNDEFVSETDVIRTAGFSKSQKTSTLNCFDSDIKCMQIKCNVRKFLKNDEIKLTLPFRADISKIVAEYGSTFTVQSQVSYILESESFTKETNIIFEENTGGTYYSVLAIVLGVLFGLILLAAIIFGLYKFNFFRRAKYEKMQQEKNENATEELTEMAKTT